MPTTDLEPVSQAKCFGGTQWVFRHASRETGTAMKFAAFIPPQADSRPVTVLWFLSGLTCTEQNVTVKAGAQRVAAQIGIALVAPDTSTPGDGVPPYPTGANDFGPDAGFYADAP